MEKYKLIYLTIEIIKFGMILALSSCRLEPVFDETVIKSFDKFVHGNVELLENKKALTSASNYVYDNIFEIHENDIILGKKTLRHLKALWHHDLLDGSPYASIFLVEGDYELNFYPVGRSKSFLMPDKYTLHFLVFAPDVNLAKDFFEDEMGYEFIKMRKLRDKWYYFIVHHYSV